jgi:hypothetical protein
VVNRLYPLIDPVTRNSIDGDRPAPPVAIGEMVGVLLQP